MYYSHPLFLIQKTGTVDQNDVYSLCLSFFEIEAYAGLYDNSYEPLMRYDEFKSPYKNFNELNELSNDWIEKRLEVYEETL